MIPTNVAAQSHTRKSNLQQKLQLSDMIQYCLVNNDGHTVRWPKMTLNLLTPEQYQDQQKNGLYRRRATSPNKVETRNVPADLYLYQAQSKQIREKIDEMIELRKQSQQRRIH
mmetsp:Transcript_9933/g.13521  ORF Transcript_9933/g.13521 Transcript_9933/m.13521 type:complete len:113 (+) Transcript_9933:497-835(+)